MAAAAGWRGVGPTALCSIGGKGVCSCTVDETPVTESNPSTRKMPGRASGILVIFNSSGNFTLVGFRFQLVVVSLSDGSVEEGGNGLCSGGSRVGVGNLGVG